MCLGLPTRRPRVRSPRCARKLPFSSEQLHVTYFEFGSGMNARPPSAHRPRVARGAPPSGIYHTGHPGIPHTAPLYTREATYHEGHFGIPERPHTTTATSVYHRDQRSAIYHKQHFWYSTNSTFGILERPHTTEATSLYHRGRYSREATSLF